jgi:hypothetical protein
MHFVRARRASKQPGAILPWPDAAAITTVTLRRKGRIIADMATPVKMP